MGSMAGSAVKPGGSPGEFRFDTATEPVAFTGQRPVLPRNRFVRPLITIARLCHLNHPVGHPANQISSTIHLITRRLQSFQ